MLFELVARGEINGQQLRLQSKQADRRHYRSALNALLDNGLLQPLSDLPGGSAYAVFGKDQSTPADQVVCRVDPFAYLSHLSAMEFHGLTDRVSKTLYVSSPPPSDWKGFARERMQRDFADQYAEYMRSELPRLVRWQLKRIRRRPISVFHRKHPGAFRQIKSSGIRVSTIGRTFLDMLREPDLCGGIRHVLQIFETSAEDYLQLVIDDIDAHGNAIDKVRAGYVLSELAELQHPTINSWKRFAQRGGSRKLYAKNEYSSTYSEPWCLSLNVD